MSSYIHNEVLLFFQSAVLGAVLLLCYDILVILRRIIPHSFFAVALEDTFYWAGTGLFTFVKIYESNQGILRAFLFLGIGLGVWVCHRSVSPVFVEICTRIIKFPVFLVKKAIKRLLFWSKRCKIWMYESVWCRTVRKKKDVCKKRGRPGEKVRKKDR